MKKQGRYCNSSNEKLKITNLYGVKNAEMNLQMAKTSFFHGGRQKSTESLLVRTDLYTYKQELFCVAISYLREGNGNPLL